jgi:hypothetical protein
MHRGRSSWPPELAIYNWRAATGSEAHGSYRGPIGWGTGGWLVGKGGGLARSGGGSWRMGSATAKCMQWDARARRQGEEGSEEERPRAGGGLAAPLPAGRGAAGFANGPGSWRGPRAATRLRSPCAPCAAGGNARPPAAGRWLAGWSLPRMRAKPRRGPHHTTPADPRRRFSSLYLSSLARTVCPRMLWTDGRRRAAHRILWRLLGLAFREPVKFRECFGDRNRSYMLAPTRW